MTERQWDVVAGIAGIAYGVLTITGWFWWGTEGGKAIAGFFASTGGIPDLNAPAADVARYYAEHQATNWTGFVFFSLAILPYMIFLGRMRSVLASAEGGSGTATSIYSIGATVGVVVPILYVTFFWMAGYRPGQVSPEITQAMQDIVMQTGPAGCMGWVAMFIGIAIVTLTRGGLPRPLGLLAIPVGACQLLYIGQGFAKDGLFSGIKGPLGAFVPYGTYLLWIIAVGVALIKRGSDTPAAIHPQPSPAVDARYR
jgi:hypothetical protein